MGTVNGTCDSKFKELTDLLAANLASGDELGASIAIDIGGELVVDLWGGWRDEGRTGPWERDTIVNVWSTTKTVTSLAALVLVSRGQLDPFAPVARYWPEFSAGGKETVEVRHLLSHTSGVPALEPPATTDDYYDWGASTSRMAAQPPWWEAGTASGYHIINFGHLIGEVVRRVSGKPLKQFVAQEIARPLGADFQIGASTSDTGRIASLVPPPPFDIDFASMDQTSVAVRAFAGSGLPDATVAHTAAWRAADIGAANGHGNARSVARLLSAVTLAGTNEDPGLLSQDTVELIFEEQSDGIDLVIGVPLRFGIGYALPQPQTFPYIPSGRVCLWGGWGGSIIAMDLERKMTFAYMMNKMNGGLIGSPRAESYVRAAYSALDVPLPAGPA